MYSGDDGSCIATAKMPQQILEDKGKGYPEAIGERKWVQCFEVIQPSIKPKTEEGVQHELLTLKYLQLFKYVFIIQLMNKEYNLHKKNIDKEKKTMMKLMECTLWGMDASEKEAYKKPPPS
jgi:hypothetical protein